MNDDDGDIVIPTTLVRESNKLIASPLRWLGYNDVMNLAIVNHIRKPVTAKHEPFFTPDDMLGLHVNLCVLFCPECTIENRLIRMCPRFFSRQHTTALHL